MRTEETVFNPLFGTLKEGDHCIYDLDGALIDTTKTFQKVVHDTLKYLKLPPISDDFLRQIWGKPTKEIWDLVGQAVGATENQAEQFGVVENIVGQDLFLNPDIITMLSCSIKKGVIISLVTSRTKAHLPLATENIGLPLEIFDFIQTADDSPYRKPDYRVFNRLSDWLNMKALQPRRTVYIGDTVNYDYMAIKNLPYKHNIEFIGVASGINTAEEFFRAGKDGPKVIGVVSGVDYLPKFVLNLLGEREKVSQHSYINQVNA